LINNEIGVSASLRVYFKSQRFYPLFHETDGKIQPFLDRHPWLKTIVLIPLIFLSGLGVGISLTLLSQKEFAALGISGYIVAIFSGLGTLITIVDRIQRWQKEKKCSYS
jgi:hypothetical protein